MQGIVRGGKNEGDYSIGDIIEFNNVQGPLLMDKSGIDMIDNVTSISNAWSDPYNDYICIIYSNKLYKYQISTGQYLGFITIIAPYMFSDDGYFICRGNGNTILKYNLMTLSPIWEIVYSDYIGGALTISMDNQYFYYATSTKVVKKCKMSDGSVVSTINSFTSSAVKTIALFRDTAITKEETTNMATCYVTNLVTMVKTTIITNDINGSYLTANAGFSALNTYFGQIDFSVTETSYDTVQGNFTSMYKDYQYVIDGNSNNLGNYGNRGYTKSSYGSNPSYNGTDGYYYKSRLAIAVIFGSVGVIFVNGKTTKYTVVAPSGFTWVNTSYFRFLAYNGVYLNIGSYYNSKVNYCLFKIDPLDTTKFTYEGVVQILNGNELNPDNPITTGAPYYTDEKVIYFKSNLATNRMVLLTSIPSYKILR